MIGSVIENALETMKGDFSILLKDLKSGKMLYERDAGRRVPSASTIKVLIMIEAFSQSLRGKFEMNGKIEVRDSEKVEFSLATYMNTDCYTARDLIVLMMTISDNTTTNVLIDKLGMDSINETGRLLGLADTVLQRKMMDLEAAGAGKQNYTSPRDMLKLVELLYNCEILTPEACREMLDIMSMTITKNYMLRSLPPEIKVAHKPGELDHLNHDIGIVFHPKGDYALGIFATGLRNNIDGKDYIAQLSKEIFEHIYTA